MEQHSDSVCQCRLMSVSRSENQDYNSVAFGTLRLISTVHSTKLCVCINFTDLTLTVIIHTSLEERSMRLVRSLLLFETIEMSQISYDCFI